MRLTRFRVQNYRTIADSDWIDVQRITALIGQNESGKSNLCEALYRVNPYVDSNYDIDEDWPVSNWGGRDRAAIVCTAEFEIADETDIGAFLEAVGPGQPGTPTAADDAAEAAAASPGKPETVLLRVSKNYENKRRFEASIDGGAFCEVDVPKAQVWAKTHLPKCVFIEDYELPSSQIELPELAARVQLPWDKLNPHEQMMAIVLQLAQIDMNEFLSLAGSPAGRTLRSFNKRQASAYLTQQFAKLWDQKQVRFDIDIDGPTLNIFVEDEGLGMPVRLSKRSTGFRWHVGFAWKFTHATRGEYKNCILLLEEPGIHLHYAAHKNLLAVFESIAKTNSIIYTTHIATMLDAGNPERVRIVEIRDHLTKVVPGVVTSQRVPMLLIESRLGLTGDMSGVLGTRQTLIVEGGDDVLILQKLSGVLGKAGRNALSDRIYLWPAEGASKTPMYAGFVIGNGWDAAVLLDSDEAGEAARKKIEELYLSDLSKAHGAKFRVFMLAKIAGLDAPDIAIEDLFPPEFYLECVNAAYRTSIKEGDLPGDQSAQITKRIDAALRAIGLSGLDKRRVMPELLKRFDSWTDIASVPAETAERAARMFRVINDAFR